MRLRSKGLVILLTGMTALLLALDCSRQFSNREIAPTLRMRPADGRLGPLTSGRGGLPQRRGGADPNLVFDPVLVYSTFLGGLALPGISQANVTLVDRPGNVYVGGVGIVQGTPGVVQPSECQTCVGFLSKIDPTGQSLVFSTNIEGISATAIAVGTSGNIYVAGQVPSTGRNGAVSQPILPIPSAFTPFQASPKGINIGILKLNSTATVILGATYLGGSGVEQVAGLAVDSGDNVYIVGNTTSNDFPTTQNALQSSLGSSGQNIFVTKLDASLSAEFYSTYLGQNSTAVAGVGGFVYQSVTSLAEGNASVAVDASKTVYIVGRTNSGFPTTTGAVQGTCPATCAFLAKLDATGSSLLYATYLAGPSGGSQAYAVAVDGFQNTYVGGTTGSGYPEVNSLQPCPNDLQGFVSEIDASGALTFSTCLGNNGNILDLVLDVSQNVELAGYSDASLLLKNPIQSNPAQSTQGGAFIASINPNSNPPSLLFSSFIGSGREGESFGGVGVDSGGNIYAAGSVLGDSIPSSFPVFNALQPTVPLIPGYGYAGAAFVMKVSPTDAAAAALSPGALVFAAQHVGMPSSPQTITVYDMGSAALTVSNATTTGDFSAQNNCGAVSPAGGTCTIPVTFTPTATGTRTGTLTITDSSAGSPRTVQLVGQGAVATATLSASSLSFPNQTVGTTSSAQGITLTNAGLLPLQVSHIQTTGAFSETNTCGNSVGVGQPCTVSVTFTPTTAGASTGTLTFTDSAPDSPQSVTLTGTGGSPTLALSVASGSSSSAKVTAGSTTTYTLSIGGGGMGGTTSLSCTGAPMKATCSVPATESVSASTASNFNVSVTTTAPTQASVFSPGIATGPWPWALVIFGIIGVAFLTRVPSQRPVLRLLWAAPLFAILLCSCGGGGSQSKGLQNPGTPAGNYTLTVTATSGSTTQSQNLTLVVQ